MQETHESEATQSQPAGRGKKGSTRVAPLSLNQRTAKWARGQPVSSEDDSDIDEVDDPIAEDDVRLHSTNNSIESGFFPHNSWVSPSRGLLLREYSSDDGCCPAWSV